MSLRWRIALAMAAVAVAISGAAAFGSYVSTRSELLEATDEFLRQRADEFDQGVRSNRREGRRSDEPRDDDVREFAGETFAEFDSVTQLLDEDGAVAFTLRNQPRLPVARADVDVADGASARIREVAVDGTDFRMITAPLRSGGAVQIGRDLGEMQQVLDGLRNRLVLLGAAATIAAATVGWLIARRTTRPIERLERSARHIAATEDLSTPIPLDGTGEVGSLAASFNSMVGSLAASREQQLRLVNDASHELRTPLTSLNTDVQMLEYLDELAPEDRRRLVARLTAETGELTALVTELVDLAAARYDEDEPIADVTLAEVAAKVARRATVRTGRTVTVSVASAPPLPMRPARIERAVSNLVENAIKYSPADEPVEVIVDGAQIAVADRGPGFDEADRRRLFERFWRAPEVRSLPGSGLGLSIVAQTIERHHGHVFARNREGGGAVVGFSLGVSPV